MVFINKHDWLQHPGDWLYMRADWLGPHADEASLHSNAQCQFECTPARLVKVYNLDIFFYKYNRFDIFGIYVNLNH